MTTRTATCIVAEVVWWDESKQPTLYGPFLPHAGSAATAFSREMEGREDVLEVVFRDVFIGPDESDCAVVATR